MLQKIERSSPRGFVNFSTISRDSHGAGKCFVYNAVAKHTKAGKPFITLYLRDVNGNSVPGYVFDLKSPLQAGSELVKVINSIVEIEWQENYLRNLGMTLIVDSVAIVTSPSAEDMARFSGKVEGLPEKRTAIEGFLTEVLGIRVTIPMTIETYASVDYAQGKVGGMCEHYWRMYKMLEQITYLSPTERRLLVATFTLYIVAHHNYVRAHESGNDGIDLVVDLTNKITALSKSLGLSAGAMELVNMFFGYQPKDIYVRTVVSVSETVQRIAKEFAIYQTIPNQQEGNAGYGAIRRYFIEEG